MPTASRTPAGARDPALDYPPPDPPRSRRDGWPWFWLMLAIATALAVWAAWGSFDDASAGRDAGITINDLTDDPGEFAGQTVTVSGDVDEPLGERTFTIGDDDKLLVVMRSNASTYAPREDEVVAVRGTARVFTLADVERESGVDLDDARVADFENRAVIIGEELFTQPGAADQPENVTASIEDIRDDAAEFYGATVTTTAPVTAVLSPSAFVLGDEILVVGSDVGRGVDEGRQVQVTGTVRQFDAAAIEDELGFGLDDGPFDEWNDRPAIVARSVGTP